MSKKKLLTKELDMAQLLDDHEFKPKVKKEPKPNKLLGLISILILGFLFQYQVMNLGTSETALVKGSYFWMPFVMTSVLGFFIPPKKAIIGGVLTVPITFLFYQLIWPAL